MRFATVLTLFVASSAVMASPTRTKTDIDWDDALGGDMTAKNHYGAPVRPWKPHSRPGWYYGPYPERHRDVFALYGPICRCLKYFPRAIQCPQPPTVPPTDPPPPSDGYRQTFSNLDGATQAGDYMTYGLVETVADCKAMCNSVVGCKFANSYRDVNGKGGTPLLTCSLFSGCHDASDATNKGGQTQPDGSVNYIANSDGWCKE